MTPHRLQQRSRLMQAVRSFFCSRDYIEVDTPIRLPVLVPESHILPFASEGRFLHTSPEMCMKRLLAKGSADIFQICHCFRREEIGRYHQEEFTMLEWYRTGGTYVDLMEECEELVCELVGSGQHLEGAAGNTIKRDGRTISLTRPWVRLSVDEAFRRYAGRTAREAVSQGLFDELLVTRIEPHLGWESPVFLYDYPVELGSLARSKEGDESLAERFELYIAGIELVNGFSELVDPVEQRKRFAREISRIREFGRGDAAMPDKLLDDLAQLADTAGAALGLDRLFMILLGLDSLSEVVCLSEQDV